VDVAGSVLGSASVVGGPGGERGPLLGSALKISIGLWIPHVRSEDTHTHTHTHTHTQIHAYTRMHIHIHLKMSIGVTWILSPMMM